MKDIQWFCDMCEKKLNEADVYRVEIRRHYSEHRLVNRDAVQDWCQACCVKAGLKFTGSGAEAPEEMAPAVPLPSAEAIEAAANQEPEF